MRKLVLLASLIAFVFSFSSCKNETPEETAKCGDENAVCPLHDAKKIFDAENAVANLIKDAIVDDSISPAEADSINNALCEYKIIDSENKEKYQKPENKDAYIEYLAIINAENNYNKMIERAARTKNHLSLNIKY